MFVSIQNGTTVIFEFICKGNFAYGLIDWRSLPELPFSLGWRHNERDGVSNHQHHECLLNRLVRRRSKKTSKLRVTGLCEGNSPVTGEFLAPMTSNAENVSIWWRHHVGELSPLPRHSNSFGVMKLQFSWKLRKVWFQCFPIAYTCIIKKWYFKAICLWMWYTSRETNSILKCFAITYICNAVLQMHSLIHMSLCNSVTTRRL